MTLESVLILKVLLWGASITLVGIWVAMSFSILREILSKRSRKSAALPTQERASTNEGDQSAFD